MIYLVMLYCLQFMTVGAIFVSIMVFFKHIFELMFSDDTHGATMQDIQDKQLLQQLFFGFYIGLIFVASFVSVALLIENAMGYFRTVAVAFGILANLAIIGIIIFLANRGLFPEDKVHVKVWQVENGSFTLDLVPTGETYFSWLCLAGILMLSIYCMPILMRPLDFLANFKTYIASFFCYMMMMPVFNNILQIYSMCNLHDVSWGNRPSNTG